MGRSKAGDKVDAVCGKSYFVEIAAPIYTYPISICILTMGCYCPPTDVSSPLNLG